MLHFQRNYFITAMLLFVVEVLIALFVKDAFFRPYGGDLLVVIFLYCLVMSVLKIPAKNAIFGVLLFAYFIEGLQYFQLTAWLGLEDHKIAAVVLGSHFEWLDMLLYTLGALIIYLVEQRRGVFF